MSQFKVGDVVQQVKLPHYVGVVVELPEMWGDDKKQSYIVTIITSITQKRNETFFAEDLKPYPYGVPNADLYLEYEPGDLVTFSTKSSSGYCSEETFYVGPREDCRCVNGSWYYPFINWEYRQTYYGSRFWGDVKKVVKPKLKIGDFVRLAGKASSPVVKIIYDRPYETHVYTLENELFVSEKRLAEFVFDEKDKSWSHKDVKLVAKPTEKPEFADNIKVGDVVQDRRVDNGAGLGVVLKAEYPRYTVNWVVIDNVAADWAEKLVYRDNLKRYFHGSVRNTSDGRKVNCVLGVSTAKGKEFYQIAASEVKVIDGTWYYPYVNLQTSELRYGSYYWKDFEEKLYPKFKLGDLIAWYASCEPIPIVRIDFNSVDKEFLYELKGGHRVTESALKLFVQAEDKVYRKEDCETADLTSVPIKRFDISYVSSPAEKPTALVTNPELAKKINDGKDSTGNVFVFGKEEYVGNFFNYTSHKIGPGIGDPKIVAKLDLPEPDPSVETCVKQIKEWMEQWPAVAVYNNPYVACIEYANDHIVKTLLETRRIHENVMSNYGMPIKDILAENSVKDTEPTGVKMNLSPVNARVIRLQSVQLLNSLSKELFTKSFSESTVANDPNKFKILGNIVDHKVPPALALSLAGFSCKYGLTKAPTSVKPVLEVLQKEFTDESQAMLTHAKWQVVKLVATDIISSFVSLVQEHLENDI